MFTILTQFNRGNEKMRISGAAINLSAVIACTTPVEAMVVMVTDFTNKPLEKKRL